MTTKSRLCDHITCIGLALPERLYCAAHQDTSVTDQPFYRRGMSRRGRDTHQPRLW